MSVRGTSRTFGRASFASAFDPKQITARWMRYIVSHVR